MRGPVFWLWHGVYTIVWPLHHVALHWNAKHDDPLVTSRDGCDVVCARGLIGSWPSGQKEYASRRIRRMADSSRGTWRLSKVGFGVPGIDLYLGSMLSESLDRHGFKASLI